MIIKLTEKATSYSNKNSLYVPTEIVEDENLSLEALGLLMLLLSKRSDKRIFTLEYLLDQSSDRKETLVNIIEELKTNEYVTINWI